MPEHPEYLGLTNKELLVQLMSRFDSLDRKLDGHMTHAAKMDALHEALAAQVHAHDRTLNGNGRPGLSNQVESMRTTIKVLGSLLFLATAASPLLVWVLA